LEFGVRADPLFAPPERVAERIISLLDRDGSGDLGADEVPDQIGFLGVAFEMADTETNGRLSAAELIAALTARRTRYATQFVATVTPHEDPLFAILDRDHDDRLDENEIRAAATELKRLDGDQDGQVQRHEVPAGVRVIVWHGETPSPFVEAMLAVPIQNSNVGRMPRWFQAMDANRDGRIAEREFLGPLERFAEFDRNRNGFWEPDELPELPVDRRQP
jgi:Ca2+-binding EF-hand superfamily protein